MFFSLWFRLEKMILKTSCKQCSCLERNHQEFKSAPTFWTGVNINVFSGLKNYENKKQFYVFLVLDSFY